MGLEWIKELSFPAGSYIKDEMEARNVSRKEMAQILNISPKDLNRFFEGKTPFTKEMAKSIEKHWGFYPSTWLKIDKEYRMHQKNLSPDKRNFFPDRDEE